MASALRNRNICTYFD
ncbi:BgTH12-00729 [Blumeria graminis f. sp. triticale]|uniref:BgTH12-00729 n=1 Tax=Blumeria graminis f. sp. triticale TaxID=1689686 RepID=A0A9W4GH42_BLUGR|nr:BgTH12-00729 [Blumeria graminis f. sp. triticale]